MSFYRPFMNEFFWWLCFWWSLPFDEKYLRDFFYTSLAWLNISKIFSLPFLVINTVDFEAWIQSWLSTLNFQNVQWKKKLPPWKFTIQEMISVIPRFSTKIYKLFERVSFMHLQHQFLIKFEVNLTKSSIQNLFGFTFLMNKNVASMVKTLHSQKCIVLKY